MLPHRKESTVGPNVSNHGQADQPQSTTPKAGLAMPRAGGDLDHLGWLKEAQSQGQRS